MREHIFTGFGFGPIQAGLFVNEAFLSGNFARIVIGEIDQKLVGAVRANNGSYFVNIARANKVEVIKVDGVELLNPNVERDREGLMQALAQSTEITTCLPSVSFYTTGGANSVAKLMSAALQKSTIPASIVYTAENNNHAAEILRKKVEEKTKVLTEHPVQYLNTVIGKMSQVVVGSGEIERMKLTPIVPGIDRAFLVEEFNRIYVTKCDLNGFRPGIEVFIEKKDLIPFEEAKLYGHNAVHALIAYLGSVKGYEKMTDVAGDTKIMTIARKAFLNESGAALTKKYSKSGEQLFTTSGYREYAEDLLVRMTNPYLADTTERLGRDPVRKLGYNDRIFGTMALALENGIEPRNMAMGAMAGIAFLLKQAHLHKLPKDLCVEDWHDLDDAGTANVLQWIWGQQQNKYTQLLIKYVQDARGVLKELTG